MANIQKRLNGTWRARYRDSAGKEHARHFARRVDAQAWRDGVTTAVDRQAPTSIRCAPERRSANCPSSGSSARSTSSPRHRRCTSRSSAPTFSRPGATFRSPASSTAMSRRWVAGLMASGLSPSHVRDLVGVLSGVLGLAMRDRRLPSNPALSVDVPRRTKRRRRYLTASEVETLAEAAGSDGRLAVLVLACCGLRRCELAALRVSSLDHRGARPSRLGHAEVPTAQ